MPGRHTALIVEDEVDMACEIADLLRSFGHDHIRAETFSDAVTHLDKDELCYILLDLEIKWDRQSIKPRVNSGMELLREIRKRFPCRTAKDMHQLPVIVISGHGKEPKNIIGAFKDGVDDFALKPLGLDGQDLGAKIRRCLELAGRNDHASCNAFANADAGDQTDGHAFWHAPDYSEIGLRGHSYVFTGEIQRRALEYMHTAAHSSDPWHPGKVILKAAQSTDSNMRMVNLFGRHPAWREVILSDGQYAHGQSLWPSSSMAGGDPF
jgi:CheY-like chemotaxis protein